MINRHSVIIIIQADSKCGSVSENRESDMSLAQKKKKHDFTEHLVQQDIFCSLIYIFSIGQLMA